MGCLSRAIDSHFQKVSYTNARNRARRQAVPATINAHQRVGEVPLIQLAHYRRNTCHVQSASSCWAFWSCHSPAFAAASAKSAGYIDRIETTATYDAYGGASFGDTGPYVVITGIAHGKLDPAAKANAGIVDLALAARCPWHG